MTTQTLIVGDDRRRPLGGTFVRSEVMPGLEYWFSEAGRARLEVIGNKELVSIDRGGGAYVLDPEKEEYCCLAQHHYTICCLSDDSAHVLLNREVLQTDFRLARTWTVGIGDWLEFEDSHGEFDEAAVRALWETLSARPPDEEHILEFRKAVHPV